MRKFTPVQRLLAALITVTCVSWAPASAYAAPSALSSGQCERQTLVAYGITRDGGLVQNSWCAPVLASSVVIATSGWEDAYAVFSAQRNDGWTYYRVSASTGKLTWSNNLTTFSEVDASLSRVDFRAFRSLMAPSPDEILALSESGLYQFVRDSSSNTWTSTRVPIAGGKLPDYLVGGGDSSLMIVDVEQSGGIMGITSTLGLGDRQPLRITIPGAVQLTQVRYGDLDGPEGSGFAITKDGQLGLLHIDGCPDGSDNRSAYMHGFAKGTYRLVFSGDARAFAPAGPPDGPIEWQCQHA